MGKELQLKDEMVNAELLIYTALNKRLDFYYWSSLDDKYCLIDPKTIPLTPYFTSHN